MVDLAFAVYAGRHRGRQDLGAPRGRVQDRGHDQRTLADGIALPGPPRIGGEIGTLHVGMGDGAGARPQDLVARAHEVASGVDLHLPGLQYDEAADAVPALEMRAGLPPSSLSRFKPELSSASANTMSNPSSATFCRSNNSSVSSASLLRPQGQRPTSARLFSSMSTMTIRGSSVRGIVARNRAS